MVCGFNKYCLATVISGFLVLSFASEGSAESGFHTQSRNLPATSTSGGRDCSELTGTKQTPGTGYVLDGTVVPADVEPVGSEIYPIVRFDLGLGKQRKKRYISPGLKGSGVRARNLSAGEVSVDTFNGEVALDGQPLTRPQNRTGC